MRRGRQRHATRVAQRAYVWIGAAVIGLISLFAVISVVMVISFVRSGQGLSDSDDARLNVGLWLREASRTRTSSTAAPQTADEKRYVSPPGERDPWTSRKLPEDWYTCIQRNLQLDAHGRPLHPVSLMRHAIPLLITPLTGDAKFFPYFVCSIDVPVRYHFVVLNERDPETVRVVDELQRRFGDSGRLIVRRNRYNRGYSGSMNQGFEWALTARGDAEVPWVFACGVDVIFEPGLLGTLVYTVEQSVHGDSGMLAALRAEVDMEERLAREGNDSYYEAWAPKGRPLKVLRSGFPGVPTTVRTAPLLPDRVRHLIRQENRADGQVTNAELRTRYFGDHVATVVPVQYALGTIAITRLALAAAGFFDENFFPAYMDDIDLRWRHYSMGFRSRVALLGRPNQYHHFNAANLRGNGFPESLAQQYGTEENYSKFAFRNYLARGNGFYDKLKYGPRHRKGVWHEAPEGAVFVHPYFNVSQYPLDTFVIDENMRRCMFERTYNYTQRAWTRASRCEYDPQTLLDGGVLGTEQAAAYRSMVESRVYEG